MDEKQRRDEANDPKPGGGQTAEPQGKKDKPGEVGAQSVTYTESEIAQMSDEQIEIIAGSNGVASGTRQEMIAALRGDGVIIHG